MDEDIPILDSFVRVINYSGGDRTFEYSCLVEAWLCLCCPAGKNPSQATNMGGPGQCKGKERMSSWTSSFIQQLFIEQ